jgi:hypothetical protein
MTVVQDWEVGDEDMGKEENEENLEIRNWKLEMGNQDSVTVAVDYDRVVARRAARLEGWQVPSKFKGRVKGK